ncbi:MAG: DUF4340 domain-containing protein [Verrucomicrobia bacterium]|nr:DUF4340 domain-containing protein [Verrucomicrobiota bacterium]MCG2681009.1 DUF4340 domain-containing protein [Kiritimatiellia bacterium]MBU4247789.1 DUF4340 domain-containing protein [Verrucomicrobiota bacterium]MBU4292077.1 DUF4340 domain-containing protein [Verrucomicrobiota bacterium]MBU4428917.1 DUF4340 domain-containing protein [Verrucomicrobiota bacterium]
MHLKTTLFLLLALSMVVGVIWMVDLAREPADQTPAEELRLLAIEPEKMVYVSFYWEGEFIECMNERGQWMIRKPVAARADASKINRILAGIEMLPQGETITPAQRQVRGLTLNDYGLTKPRARIVLGDPDKRYLLEIGNESPLKNAVYVQIDQQDCIVATSTNILGIIPRHVAELRDTRLLQGSPSYVRRLEIKRANRPLVQIVKEGAEWIMRKPVVARADWSKVSRLLENLFSLPIQEFVSETMSDPVAYGLSEDEAMLQVSVWQEGEKDVDKLVFGKKANEQGSVIYAGRRASASVFTVDRARVDVLVAGMAELRDPRLYFMAPEKMAVIRIEEGERALEFRKNGESGWQIVEPAQWKADNRMVADLVSRLNTFRIDQVIDGTNVTEAGLNHPAHVIRVAEEYPASGITTQGMDPTASGPVEKLKRILLMSAPQPGKEYVFARFEDEPLIYRISASSSSTISMDPLSYRDCAVLTLDPSAIRKITLKKNGTEQAVERSGTGTWKPVVPATGDANLNVVTNLLARAADLRVLRFERSDIRDLAVYGLKDAHASLTFSLSGEEGIQKSLLFGENSEDLGVYAMFQGQDMVFVLEKALVDTMVQELVR